MVKEAPFLLLFICTLRSFLAFYRSYVDPSVGMLALHIILDGSPSSKYFHVFQHTVLHKSSLTRSSSRRNKKNLIVTFINCVIPPTYCCCCRSALIAFTPGYTQPRERTRTMEQTFIAISP